MSQYPNAQYPNANPGPAPRAKSPALMIGIILGVLVVIGAVVTVLLMMNKRQPDNAATQASPESKPVAVVLPGPVAAQVDATEMLNLYRDHPADAEAKYNGKVIEVTGMLRAKLDSNFAGERALALEGGVQRFAGVRCVLPEANYFQMDEVQPGDTVTIRGRCEGLITDVILRESAVVNKISQ